jgi:hypothetical protein
MRPDPELVCRAGFGLGIAAVVAVWWSSGPSADPRLDAARLAGLLAAYLLAVQILLRARLPYVENGVEVGVLARWHRRGGQRLVSLAAGHAALVVPVFDFKSSAIDTGLCPQSGIPVDGPPSRHSAGAGAGLGFASSGVVDSLPH